MILLLFLPLIALVVLANYGEKYRWVRFLTYGLLALLNSLFGWVGLMFLLLQWLANRRGASTASSVNFLALAIVFLATGLIAFLPFLPPLRRLLARAIPINPASGVHTTALVLAIYLIGTSLLNLYAIPLVLEFPGELELSPAVLWQQELAFAILGLAGVGLFLRRNPQAALERLKLRRVPLSHWWLAAGTTGLLIAFGWGLALGWSRLWPGSYETVGRISEILFGNFSSPLGALTLGLSAGVGEELLFRGALQPRFGLWLTTILFAVAHTQYAISPAILEIFVAGLALGLLRNRTSTTVCIIVHTAYNAFTVLLAPYFP